MTRRSIVVTGAANGIGAEIARRAAADGYRVGVLDIDAVGAEQLAATLPDAVALVAASNDEDQVEAALDRFGVPDALVNNAGIVRFGPLLEQPVDDWRAVVDVNLTGSFVCARAVARRMIDAGRPGAIVSISSINGVAPGPNAGAYGATKAGIALLTKQMAVEWGPHGIRANAVAPGLIDGGMSTPIFADPEFRRMRESKVPMQRLGTEADIAHAVLWLCSEEASYVSGHELVVDGAVVTSIIANLPRPKAVDHVGATNG